MGAATSIGLALSFWAGPVAVLTAFAAGLVASELLLVAVPRWRSATPPHAVVHAPLPQRDAVPPAPDAWRALDAFARRRVGAPTLEGRLRVIPAGAIHTRRLRLATDPVLVVAIWSTAEAARSADAELGLGVGARR